MVKGSRCRGLAAHHEARPEAVLRILKDADAAGEAGAFPVQGDTAGYITVRAALGRKQVENGDLQLSERHGTDSRCPRPGGARPCPRGSEGPG